MAATARRVDRHAPLASTASRCAPCRATIGQPRLIRRAAPVYPSCRRGLLQYLRAVHEQPARGVELALLARDVHRAPASTDPSSALFVKGHAHRVQPFEHLQLAVSPRRPPFAMYACTGAVVQPLHNLEAAL